MKVRILVSDYSILSAGRGPDDIEKYRQAVLAQARSEYPAHAEIEVLARAECDDRSIELDFSDSRDTDWVYEQLRRYEAMELDSLLEDAWQKAFYKEVDGAGNGAPKRALGRSMGVPGGIQA